MSGRKVQNQLVRLSAVNQAGSPTPTTKVNRNAVVPVSAQGVVRRTNNVKDAGTAPRNSYGLGRRDDPSLSYANKAGNVPPSEGLSLFIIPASNDRLIIEGGELDPCDLTMFHKFVDAIMHNNTYTPSSLAVDDGLNISRTLYDFNRSIRSEMLIQLSQTIRSDDAAVQVALLLTKHGSFDGLSVKRFTGMTIAAQCDMIIRCDPGAPSRATITERLNDKTVSYDPSLDANLVRTWFHDFIVLRFGQFQAATREIAFKKSVAGKVSGTKSDTNRNLLDCQYRSLTDIMEDMYYATSVISSGHAQYCNICATVMALFMDLSALHISAVIPHESTSGKTSSLPSLIGMFKYWFDISRKGSKRLLSELLLDVGMSSKFSMSHPRDICFDILKNVAQSEALIHKLNGHDCIQSDNNNRIKLRNHILTHAETLAARGAGVIMIRQQHSHGKNYIKKGSADAIMTFQMPRLSCSQVVLDRTLTIDVPNSSNIPMGSAVVVDSASGRHVDAIQVNRTLSVAMNDAFIALKMNDVLTSRTSANGFAVILEPSEPYRGENLSKTQQDRRRVVGRKLMSYLENIATDGKSLLDTISAHILAMLVCDTSILGEVSIYLNFMLRSKTIMCAPITDNLTIRRAEQRIVVVQEGGYSARNDAVDEIFKRITLNKTERKDDDGGDMFN